eukprot:gene32009-41511_t
MATSIVYIGCHRSINLLRSEEEGGVAASERETLSAADAYKFPFIGSAALFGLYAAFKFFDKDTVNIILAVYFSLAGVYTLTSSFSKFASLFITSTKRFGLKFSEILCLIIAIIFSGVYVKTKHFMMNNILGISFCIQSIEKISVGSYKIGGILLIGLFFYDIFWVFGTDVMVTVAKSFDGPIKLLFPRVLANAAAGIKGEFSLLGLGDIVVPGLFVSLLLRFDTVRAGVPAINAEYMSFSKPYFNVNIICYALGLCCTVGVMYFFNAAQPALLYLGLWLSLWPAKNSMYCTHMTRLSNRVKPK